MLVTALTIDDKTAIAGSDRAEMDGCGVGFPENHIGAASVAAAGWIAIGCADQQISEAITIHIAGRGNAAAALVVGAGAIDHKAAATVGNGGEIDGGCGGRPGFAEDHIGTSAIRSDHPGIPFGGTDQHIAKPITIDIPHPGYAPAAVVVRFLSIDYKSSDSAGNIQQIDRDTTGRAGHAAGVICDVAPIAFAGGIDTGSTIDSSTGFDLSCPGLRSADRRGVELVRIAAGIAVTTGAG